MKLIHTRKFIFPAVLCSLFLAAPLFAQTRTESLTLEQAYDRALETDQTIRIAYEETRKANLLPWSALTRYGPNVSLNGSLQHPERDIVGSRVETKKGDVTVVQPLIDLSVFPALKQGKLAKQSAGLAYQLSIRNVLFGVTSAYYSVLKQQQIVEVNNQTLELAKQQLDLAQKRFDVGEVTKTDVLRARVNKERAQRALTESQNALRLARNILGNILNFGVETTLVLAEPPLHETNVDALETAEKQAAEKREDLRIAALATEQTRARHREVMTNYAPRASVQWSNQWIDPSTPGQPNDFWDALFTIRIPLFEGGQRELDFKRTGHEITQTQLARENLSKDVEVEVKEAWLRVKTLEQTLVAVKAEVEAAEESYKTLQNQYKAGAATSLDVFSALSDLNSAKTALAVQTYDYQISLRNLERAVGVFQQERVQKTKPPEGKSK